MSSIVFQSGDEGGGILIAQLVRRSGSEPSVEEIVNGAMAVLRSTSDSSASIKAADYIKSKTKNIDKQIKVLEGLRARLLASGEYEEASVDRVIADIRQRLALPGAGPTAAVGQTSHAALTYKLVSVKKTGSFGGDGSPQVVIRIHIENLPTGADTLTGFIRTNQDWPAGMARTQGRTSGDFEFLAYLYPGNAQSPFYIKISDKNGKQLGRVPDSEYEFIQIPFPND